MIVDFAAHASEDRTGLIGAPSKAGVAPHGGPCPQGQRTPRLCLGGSLPPPRWPGVANEPLRCFAEGWSTNLKQFVGRSRQEEQRRSDRPKKKLRDNVYYIFMGQKVHPLGFRLGITQQHRSQWFAKPKQYSLLVVEDHFLRQAILAKFPEAGIVSVGIQRKVDQIRIDICAARPRAIVAFGGQDLDNLRRHLAQSLRAHRDAVLHTAPFSSNTAKPTAQLAIYITKLSNPNVSAGFLSDFLVEQLEKRIPFRRAMKSAVQRAQRAQIKGIKIQVAGRLNGAEIARSEWLRKGQVPLQTLRANVNYSYRTASTIYGLLGIKVWTFHGLADSKSNQKPAANG